MKACGIVVARWLCVAAACVLHSTFARISRADDALDARMETARRAAWTNFYSPQTRLFYDFLETLESGKTLDHLPTAAEIDALDPNACGYGTAMEDCAISGGVALEALVARWEAEKSRGASAEELDAIKAQGAEVFAGLELLATVSGSRGFVARGVSPKAPGKCYVNSSRDQVTHLVLATREFFCSPLADASLRARAKEILYAVADRMTQNVVPENDFDFLCCDGSRCRIGICRMKNVEDHEAARLTAIYAVACDAAAQSGDVEREREYRARWREIAPETIKQSAHIMENPSLYNRMPSYALLQMQESLAVLYELEPDAELKDLLARTMKFVAELAKGRQSRALATLRARDLTATAPNWREVGGLNGEYRATWYASRECGELAETIEFDVAQDSFDPESVAILKSALETPDYAKLTSCGILHLLAAYEKARRLGKL